MNDSTKKCPHHNKEMILMYGCGWDYDRYLCGEVGCDYEIELDTSTCPDEEEAENER